MKIMTTTEFAVIISLKVGPSKCLAMAVLNIVVSETLLYTMNCVLGPIKYR